MQLRLTPVRERFALGFGALWFAACALLRLNEDLWYALLFGGPAVPVLAMAATYTVRTPASALTTFNWSAFSKWFLRPNAAAFILPVPLTAVIYAGAGISQLTNPDSGLSGVLNNAGDSDPDANWWLPILTSALGLLTGFMILLVLVVPARAAIDAVQLRSSDRAEARGLAAFVTFWCGLLTTAVAGACVFVSGDDDASDSDRFTAIRDEFKLLVGQGPDGTSYWWVVLGWIGIGLLLTSANLWLRDPPQK